MDIYVPLEAMYTLLGFFVGFALFNAAKAVLYWFRRRNLERH